MNEIDSLRNRGHAVVPFCAKHLSNRDTKWSSYFPNSASFENPGVIDALRYIYSVNAKKSIRRLLNDFSPDVVHCHIYYGKLTSSILSEVKKRSIPLIQTLHEFKIVCPVYTRLSEGNICSECTGFKFYNVVKKNCNRGSKVRSLLSCIESYVSMYLGSISKFDCFIAVSDFLRHEVISMGVPAEKVKTIHNYIDAKTIVPMYKGGNYFLFLGRLEKYKGIWQLVEAFRQMPQVQLMIAGAGPEEVAMACYLQQKDIRNIEMLGFNSGRRLAEIIRGAFCVVVPSTWYETFGLTVAEAFAYGKPVIASRIGGIPEVVDEGEDSTLVEPERVS